MPESKPHYNTLSTIVCILEDKGVVAPKSCGKLHEYYPIVSLEDYRTPFVKDSVKKYFDNLVSNLVNYFVKDEQLREIASQIRVKKDELTEIKKKYKEEREKHLLMQKQQLKEAHEKLRKNCFTNVSRDSRT